MKVRVRQVYHDSQDERCFDSVGIYGVTEAPPLPFAAALR